MKRLSFAIAAALFTAAPLSAQTTFRGQSLNPGQTVTGAALTARNSFNGGLAASVATQDFESIPMGSIASGLTLNFGFAGNATIQGSGSVTNTVFSDAFATSGSRYVLATVGPSSSFEVTFAQRVAAFGFYGTDLGDFNGRLTLEFFNGSSLIDEFLVQDGDLTGAQIPELNGNLLFWGVQYGSNAFDRINFRMEGSIDVFSFDDMTVADARDVIGVPEPGSVALALTGLVGLGLVARRRRA